MSQWINDDDATSVALLISREIFLSILCDHFFHLSLVEILVGWKSSEEKR